MKHCYISGAITGCEGYEAKFETACKTVSDMGYYPVNPVWLLHPANATWSGYMRADIIALMKCQVIYMLTCWKGSKGAKIEHDLAVALGMEVVYAL